MGGELGITLRSHMEGRGEGSRKGYKEPQAAWVMKAEVSRSPLPGSELSPLC